MQYIALGAINFGLGLLPARLRPCPPVVHIGGANAVHADLIYTESPRLILIHSLSYLRQPNNTVCNPKLDLVPSAPSIMAVLSILLGFCFTTAVLASPIMTRENSLDVTVLKVRGATATRPSVFANAGPDSSPLSPRHSRATSTPKRWPNLPPKTLRRRDSCRARRPETSLRESDRIADRPYG